MSDRESELRAQVLRERARKIAARSGRAATREVHAHAVVVSVGAEHFAIPSDGVRELVPMPHVTRLPGTPRWIRGIAYCRGEIVSAVDLGAWFGVAMKAEPRYLALLRGPEGFLGLGVEEVVGFRTIHVDEITPVESGSHRPVAGMTKDVVALLDIGRVVGSEDVRVR